MKKNQSRVVVSRLGVDDVGGGKWKELSQPLILFPSCIEADTMSDKNIHSCSCLLLSVMGTVQYEYSGDM